MSETGATAEQKAKAADALIRQRCGIGPRDSLNDVPLWQINKADDQVEAVAPHLVPVGMVIANAADVISPDLKAAMGRAHEFIRAQRAYWDKTHDDREEFKAVVRADDALTDADLALLRAASEGSAS